MTTDHDSWTFDALRHREITRGLPPAGGSEDNDGGKEERKESDVSGSKEGPTESSKDGNPLSQKTCCSIWDLTGSPHEHSTLLL